MKKLILSSSAINTCGSFMVKHTFFYQDHVRAASYLLKPEQLSTTSSYFNKFLTSTQEELFGMRNFSTARTILIDSNRDDNYHQNNNKTKGKLGYTSNNDESRKLRDRTEHERKKVPPQHYTHQKLQDNWPMFKEEQFGKDDIRFNNANRNRSRRHHQGHQFNRMHNKPQQERNKSEVETSVENEVSSMVSKLLSRANVEQTSVVKYKEWKYPTFTMKCPDNFDFTFASTNENETTLMATPLEEEKVEKFKSFMFNYVKKNSNFKSKSTSMNYEFLFDIFCLELLERAKTHPEIATLVDEVLKFHPEKIVRRNQKTADTSVFSNVLNNEFMLYDFNKITEIALGNSNFSTEFSKWFNSFIQQRYPSDFKLYVEALRCCDMTNPFKFYKNSIPFGRKVIYHLGPTNSGKTHAALTALSAAENGVYCGPLRLLAQEVFTKMNTKYGCKCNLLTGQEKRIIPGANHVACTVEMADLNEIYDVAVIDEIQMIEDNQRGSAWTRALLGLKAREIHVCGDGSALEIVKNLVFGDSTKSSEDTGIEVIEVDNPNHIPTEDETATGENLYHYHQPVAADKLLYFSKPGVSDTLEVVPYTRMKPLEICSESLHGDVKNIRDFDCIVTFSRNEIYEIKKLIEVNTGIKCCVIYGALPPEVRTDQAELFNESADKEQDEFGNRDYSVLVASDAVGMGLNLNIKRVIFYKMTKYDNTKQSTSPLEPSLVKQIAGRAGRRGFHEHGQVTTFFDSDLEYLHQCMNAPNTPIEQAGIFPEWSQIEQFAKVYKNLPDNDEGCGISIRDVLEKFFSLSKIHKNFFFCDVQQALELAAAIDEAGPNITLKQKFDFVNAPVPGFDRAKEMHIRYVEDFSNPKIATVPLHIDLGNILRILDKIREKSKTETKIQNTYNSVGIYLQEALKNIEFYHRMIDLYMWLANKYPLRFDKDAAEQAREVLMSELTESLFNQTEENKKLKSIGMLKENAPRAFEYVSFKRTNQQQPLDPSLQGLKRVMIGGKEYLRKNQYQVLTLDGKQTRDIVDVMADSLGKDDE
ncbi:hypothetical protein FDP41_008353 [Naegleria fowleri]|uniref:RNA helicase n=1 Tax=Naegleria fowleri TaxID=5763 RepID=A0A6A5BEW7_NAEFO|nr:uncharacterized protein FDP41_008353 [Naegleria fowleri]KAF0973146.1 hypothetical protein FDP41_008353 [Naegleria fowleri]CAG4719750.1 unnamed protein product [Naegleria fowleri]